MKQTCEVCDEPIVSSLDLSQWFHQPRGDVAVMNEMSGTPRPHRATPAGEPIHGCQRRYDPHCPACIEAGPPKLWPARR